MDNLDVKKPEFMNAAFKKIGEMDVDDNPLSQLSFADLYCLSEFACLKSAQTHTLPAEVCVEWAKLQTMCHDELNARTKFITGLDL